MKRGALNTIIKKIQSECCLEEPTKITYFWNDKNQAVFKLFFDSLYIPDDLVLEEEDVLNTFSRQDAYLYEDDFRIDEINTKKGYLTFIPNTQDFKTVSRYKDAKEAKDDSKDKSEIQQECYLVMGKHLNEAFSRWNNFILQEEDDDDQQEVEQDTETAEVETDEASAEQENQSDGTQETENGDSGAENENTDEPNDDGKPDDEDTDANNSDDIMSNDDHQKAELKQKSEEKSDKPSSVNSAYLNCFSLPAPLTTAGSAALRKTLGSILNGEAPVVKGASGKDEVKKVVCFDVNQSVELTETTGASFQVFSDICKEICGGETWAYSAVASGNALSQKLDSMKGGSVRYLDKGSASIVQKSNVAGIKGLTVEGGEDAEQNSAQTANLGEFNSITQIVKQILTEYRAECKKWGGGPKPIGDTKDHSTGGDKVSSGTKTQGGSENDKDGTGYEDTAEGQEASKGTDENGLADASTTDKDNPPEDNKKPKEGEEGSDEQDSENSNENPKEGENSDENANNSNDQNGEKAQDGKQGDQPKEGGEETGNPDTNNNDTAKVPGTKDVAMAGTPDKAEIDAAIQDWGKKEEAFNKDQENPEVYCALAYCRDYYTKDMNGVEKQDQEDVKKFKQVMEKFKQDCISGKVNIGSSKDLKWKERFKLSFAAGKEQMEQLGRNSMGAKRIDDIEDKAGDSLFSGTHQTGTNSAVQTVDGQEKEKEEIKDVGNAYPYYFNVFCYNNANFKKLREFFKGNKELKFLKSGGGGSK